MISQAPFQANVSTTLHLYAKPEHKSAARMVGYALTLRNDWGCQAASYVFRHRLIAEDRAILVLAVLDSLTEQEFEGTIRHFCKGALDAR